MHANPDKSQIRAKSEPKTLSSLTLDGGQGQTQTPTWTEQGSDLHGRWPPSLPPMLSRSLPIFSAMRVVWSWKHREKGPKSPEKAHQVSRVDALARPQTKTPALAPIFCRLHEFWRHACVHGAVGASVLSLVLYAVLSEVRFKGNPRYGLKPGS